ncbi:DUF502 domain-containing protein [Candidatus Liberibacter africanus]|uniref:Transmembrane protein n=1 Tax=Candidatus Liberibacter africanus PTSAPSY TaxID=1277257 RepID=A0A0G3IA23_LIBAF|nr:DUF502 domain-containing protein [Candidatus Liberibacter africanus]AKK20672.1 hypothetical protein G293_05315 [Candidatus Liberibacter africanus PTSAPSY]
MKTKHFHLSVARRLRNNFFSGLVICAPIAITIVLTWSLVNWFDSFIMPYIPIQYNPKYYFDIAIPGYGLLIVVIFITTIGFLGRNLLGRFVFFLSEFILNNTPIVQHIYKSIKQIIRTILKEDSTSFKNACLVEYPSAGLWSLCFLTTDVKGELKEKFSDLGYEDMVTVFIPPTPLPTAGMLIFVPREKVIKLKMSAEDSAKMLISGGLVIPDDIISDEKDEEDSKKDNI